MDLHPRAHTGSPGSVTGHGCDIGYGVMWIFFTLYFTMTAVASGDAQAVVLTVLVLYRTLYVYCYRETEKNMNAVWRLLLLAVPHPHPCPQKCEILAAEAHCDCNCIGKKETEVKGLARHGKRERVERSPTEKRERLHLYCI